MSAPLALHSWAQAEAAAHHGVVPGRQPTVASALTLRIPHGSKLQIQLDLEDEGYTMKRLFPDAEGFRSRSAVVRALLP